MNLLFSLGVAALLFVLVSVEATDLETKLTCLSEITDEEDDKPKQALDPDCMEEAIKKLKKDNFWLKREIEEVKKQVKNDNFWLTNEIEDLKKLIKEKDFIRMEENRTCEMQIQELKNQSDQDGTRDIFEASKVGSLPGVKYWYEKDPSCINKKDGNYANWTPLHYSAEFGHLKVVEFLLSKGAEVDSGNAEDSTPLMCASFKGQVPIIELFLSKGANINKINKDKMTPLHCALDGNQIRAVKLLIERGADQTIKNASNKTPKERARECSPWRYQIADYLSSLK